MAAPDAEVNGTDYAQRANMLERNIAGTALESSFRDKLRKMISVRPPVSSFPSILTPSTSFSAQRVSCHRRLGRSAPAVP
jgi:hypothetical protein